MRQEHNRARVSCWLPPEIFYSHRKAQIIMLLVFAFAKVDE